MKLIRLILFLVAIVIGISIGISNYQPVRLGLEPVPFSIELPLYIIIFACFLGGMIFGGLVVWWRDGQVRKRARRAEQKAGQLQRELAASETETVGKTNLPATRAA